MISFLFAFFVDDVCPSWSCRSLAGYFCLADVWRWATSCSSSWRRRAHAPLGRPGRRGLEAAIFKLSWPDVASQLQNGQYLEILRAGPSELVFERIAFCRQGFRQSSDSLVEQGHPAPSTKI